MRSAADVGGIFFFYYITRGILRGWSVGVDVGVLTVERFCMGAPFQIGPGFGCKGPTPFCR